jgi:RNA polymerase sigma-70 factor (ECF subfamily)
MENYQHDFELVFKHYYSRLCHYACKFIDEDFVAEDIVQEIFSNLWEKQINLESDAILKAYLFRSVHNRCLNYINYRKITEKHHRIIQDKFVLMELEYYDSEQGNAKSLFELEVKIEEVISTLPDQCKNVFELSRQKGLKNREIAAMLNISVSVVEKHISKALRIMRESLKDYLILILFFLKIF